MSENRQNEHTPHFKLIPVSCLDEGMELCASNVRQLIADAYSLLEQTMPSPWNAGVLAIFAYEELAKYAELKKARDTTQGDTAKIDSRWFSNHDYKHSKAREWNLVPPASLDLLGTVFDKATFDRAPFDAKPMIVDSRLRLQFLFVDWNGKNWVGRPSIMSVDDLTKFIIALEDCLTKLTGRKPPPPRNNRWPPSTSTVMRLMSRAEGHVPKSNTKNRKSGVP